MKVSDPARVAEAPTVHLEFEIDTCTDCGARLAFEEVTISGPIFEEEIGEIGRFKYSYCDRCNLLFRYEASSDD